jgi:hypothetical protein
MFQVKITDIYEDVSKSIRTGRLERELKMVQLSAIGRSCIDILRASLVSFAVITLCVVFQRVFVVVVVYFVIDSVRKLLDTLSYYLRGVVLLLGSWTRGYHLLTVKY